MTDLQLKTLLNCEKFEILEIEDRGDGHFNIKFMADSIKGLSKLHFPAEEQPPFISALWTFKALIYPLLLPSINGVIFKKLKQKNSEGAHSVCFEVSSSDGYGLEIKTAYIPIDDGATLAEAMHDLTMAAKIEVSRGSYDPQQYFELEEAGDGQN